MHLKLTDFGTSKIVGTEKNGKIINKNKNKNKN